MNIRQSIRQNLEAHAIGLEYNGELADIFTINKIKLYLPTVQLNEFIFIFLKCTLTSQTQCTSSFGAQCRTVYMQPMSFRKAVE